MFSTFFLSGVRQMGLALNRRIVDGKLSRYSIELCENYTVKRQILDAEYLFVQ